MSKDEESKNFAKINPIKVKKEFTKDELKVHKKKLEQYYKGESIEDTNINSLKKPQVFNLILFVILALAILMGIIFQYLL